MNFAAELEQLAIKRFEEFYLKEAALITKTESPDFLIKFTNGNTIGLEVTESCYQQFGIIRKLSNRYFNKGMTANKIKDDVSNKLVSKFLENGGCIESTDNITILSPYQELTDTSTHLERFLHSVNTKLVKLNSNYLQCTNNMLYVFPTFTSAFNNASDITEIINKLTSLAEKYDKLFHKIFIDLNDVIHIYSLENKAYTFEQEIIITPE